MIGGIFSFIFLLTVVFPYHLGRCAYGVVDNLHFRTANGIPMFKWQALNDTINGRLRNGVPFSRSCFPIASNTGGDFNATNCLYVMQQYANPAIRIETFGAYMNTEWETCQAEAKQCLLDFTNTTNPSAFSPPRICSQGSVPKFYIDVRDAADVLAAYDFAEATGVTLVIKNTGHDYAGRSSAPDSLALWTHNLQSISYDANFLAPGCLNITKMPAVTYGAGVTFDKLYAFADRNNITIPGGGAGEVGAAGGWLQGGGHSIISNSVGLGVDRVLQFRIVTPSGEYLTANQCQNADLFYALRGGGGGTFGVVMEVTTQALPPMSIPTVFATFNGSTTSQREFLAFIISNALEYATQGWGGYILPTGNIIFANPTLNETVASTAMESLRLFVTTKLNGTYSLTVEPSYLSFYNAFVAPYASAVGVPSILSSRLVPSDNFKSLERQQQLLDVLTETFNESSLSVIFAVAPFYFQGVNGPTSVTDAWRSSLWHVVSSAYWNYNSSRTEIQEVYRTSTKAMDNLRTITPHSGAYQNEADVYEPDFQRSFWGENYGHLVVIKEK